MNARNINTVLSNKFADFLKSIEDPELRKKVKNNSIITGGAIVSLLLGEKVNDYDIYFTDFETTKEVADYYVEKFKELNKNSNSPTPAVLIEDPKETSSQQELLFDVEDSEKSEKSSDKKRIRIFIQSTGIVSESDLVTDPNSDFLNPEYDTDFIDADFIDDSVNEQTVLKVEEADATPLEENQGTKYRPIFITDNAISLSNGIQLVIRFYGDPKEIHDNYDFVHCTNYWTSSNKKLVLKKEALESILAKELKYIGSLYPICSFIRIRKFMKRGWYINAGQILKIALQISELNLKDINVLQEQLLGVDTAYFNRMLEYIKKKNSESSEVNFPYIVSIIDKIF